MSDNNGYVTIICFTNNGETLTSHKNGCCLELEEMPTIEIQKVIKAMKKYNPKKHKITFFVKIESLENDKEDNEPTSKFDLMDIE